MGSKKIFHELVADYEPYVLVLVFVDGKYQKTSIPSVVQTSSLLHFFFFIILLRFFCFVFHIFVFFTFLLEFVTNI